MSMPYKKIIGIYKITNTKNNKLYIGSALSIKSRFAQHLYRLKRNKHFNSHLQSSWNKYGENSFVFEIIEICDKLQLKTREEYFIALYKSNNRFFGYNKRLDCTTNLGLKANKETRKKLRISHLGHKRSKQTQEKISKSQFKPVYQINNNLELINKFESIKQASEITGFCSRSISLCATKKMQTHPKNLYYWCFESEYNSFSKPETKWKTKKIKHIYF
jgi:hypothetical protein